MTEIIPGEDEKIVPGQDMRAASASVPSPWDLRADLVRRVTADLLGPLEGEKEVILGYQLKTGKWSSPGRVRDRYLVGMLAPRGQSLLTPNATTTSARSKAMTSQRAVSRMVAIPGW